MADELHNREHNSTMAARLDAQRHQQKYIEIRNANDAYKLAHANGPLVVMDYAEARSQHSVYNIYFHLHGYVNLGIVHNKLITDMWGLALIPKWKEREIYEQRIRDNILIADSQFRLGILYYHGSKHYLCCTDKQKPEPEFQDFRKAHEYFTQAAAQGHEVAQFYLKYLFNPDSQGISADEYGQVLAQLETAADANDIEAQYFLGFVYDRSIGLEPRPHKACAWYKEAAAQNHVKAALRLGRMYRYGVCHAPALGPEWNLSSDLAEARRWYGKAAELGSSEALEILQELDSNRLSPRP